METGITLLWLTSFFVQTEPLKLQALANVSNFTKSSTEYNTTKIVLILFYFLFSGLYKKNNQSVSCK